MTIELTIITAIGIFWSPLILIIIYDAVKGRPFRRFANSESLSTSDEDYAAFFGQEALDDHNSFIAEMDSLTRDFEAMAEGRTKLTDITYLDQYRFSPNLIKRFAGTYGTTEKETELVFSSLITYFKAIGCSDGPVAMPSAIVDDAWHMFLIYTKDYAEFCDRVFGRYIHHDPNSDGGDNSASMKRIWDFCCKEIGQDSGCPEKIPPMFILDTHFNHKKGFRYNFSQVRNQLTNRGDQRYHFLYLMLNQVGYRVAFEDSPYFEEN